MLLLDDGHTDKENESSKSNDEDNPSVFEFLFSHVGIAAPHPLSKFSTLPGQ